MKQGDLLSEMTSTSLEIKIHNFKGENYIYKIPKLHKEIDPEQSTVLAKGKYVEVKLRKVVNEHWTDLRGNLGVFFWVLLDIYPSYKHNLDISPFKFKN